MEGQRKAVCTIGLVAINVIVFVLLSFGGSTENSIYMLEHGVMYVPYIFGQKEYYRFLTSIFVHFGFPHLMNNMVTLLVLGGNVELVIGKIKFLIIYLLSGLGGNLLSLLAEVWSGRFHISAGASGAIFGLTGAMLCLVLMNHGRVGSITKQRMIAMTVMSLYSGFSNAGVNNFAHVGGLLTGMFVTWLICRKSNLESCSIS